VSEREVISSNTPIPKPLVFGGKYPVRDRKMVDHTLLLENANAIEGRKSNVNTPPPVSAVPLLSSRVNDDRVDTNINSVLRNLEFIGQYLDQNKNNPEVANLVNSAPFANLYQKCLLSVRGGSDDCTPPSVCLNLSEVSKEEVILKETNNLYDDPQSYDEAMKRPDKEYWIKAMEEEISSLEALGTFNYNIVRPVGTPIVGSRWVYKLKLNRDGSIDRYKARLVAQGFSQVEGVN
jgi:hypothetical protein